MEKQLFFLFCGENAIHLISGTRVFRTAPPLDSNYLYSALSPYELANRELTKFIELSKAKKMSNAPFFAYNIHNIINRRPLEHAMISAGMSAAIKAYKSMARVIYSSDIASRSRVYIKREPSTRPLVIKI